MAAQTLTRIAVLSQSNTDADSVNVGVGFGREAEVKEIGFGFRQNHACAEDLNLYLKEGREV